MKKKTTARERRAEERQILAQMDEAMARAEQPQREKDSAAQPKKQPKTKNTRKYDDSMPQQVHCKRCRTLMENGVCPACGFKIYVPMDEEKRKKIKLITTVVAVVVFIALFVALQFKNS